MKKLSLLLLIFLIPIATALEECKGTIVSRESPCHIFLPYTGTCSDVTVSFYNVSEQIYTQTMEEYSGFLCNATFNISNTGTYSFNYSNGDSGSIVIQEDENMMLAITVGLGIFASLLFFIAFKLEDNHFIMKLIMFIVGITTIILLPVTYITGDTSLLFHKITVWFFVIFWIYVSVYFIYYLFNRMARTVQNENQR